MTVAGYEYPSAREEHRYWGSIHGVDLGIGWVRLLVAMTVGGYEYPSAEVKAEVLGIDSWSRPRCRMGTAARRDDDCRLWVHICGYESRGMRINSWNRPRYRMGTAARLEDDRRL
jgi:hypothetical protein